MYIKKDDEVDILMICEGTFPYIKGGVSSWIYQLIKSLKEFSFGIVFLGGSSKDYGEMKYDIPENVKHIETHFLFDKVDFDKTKRIKENKDLIPKMRNLHYWFREHEDTLSDELKKIEFYKKIDHNQFLFSKNSFKFITQEYEKNCSNVPFIDYFWTVRNIHAPIWIIAKIAQNIPNFKLVHSPSTGYAGFLSSFLKNNYHKKFILTEHGIYLLERKIDIVISSWIKEYKLNIFKDSAEENYIKNLWIRFFTGINKFAYETADKIISLYSGARNLQLNIGAKIEKTQIIPNGIDIKKFYKGYQLRDKTKIPKVVSLIGRVVPIKDIKTFITAIKIASNSLPDIEGWIIGPYDEDKDYYDECINLVRSLDLENNIKFLGMQKTDDILSKIGLLTLTSISEGMPLVVLEAFAAGVPVVATDVGSCNELIYGKDEEDFKIGKAGEIVPVSNPKALAVNYLSILTNMDLWKKYSNNALERVKRYYDEDKMIEEYRKLYLEFIS